jgi:hypothetical protein
MQKLSSIAILVLSLALLGNGSLFPCEAKASGKKPLVQSTSSRYSFEDYKKECLQRARKEGLSKEDAEKLCTCTINRFRSRYTIVQFRSLVQKSKTNKAARATLTQVGEQCFEEILYES